MVNEKSGVQRIVIITKELGKKTFIYGNDWKKFKLSDYTLHSTTEPAFQEYYRDGARFVWFFNGMHHRPNAPSVYKIYFRDFSSPFNHNLFKIDKDAEGNDTILHGRIDVLRYNAFNMVQFHLNGKQYNNGGESFKTFLKDSVRFSRGNKLLEIFKDDE